MRKYVVGTSVVLVYVWWLYCVLNWGGPSEFGLWLAASVSGLVIYAGYSLYKIDRLRLQQN